MCDRHKANVAVARAMPLVLTGMAGYTTYVFIVRLCINYILHPPPIERQTYQDPAVPTIVEDPPVEPRTATAIGLIVGYLIFLIIMAAAYFRLVYTVMISPGYTPKGPNAYGRSGEGKQAWAPSASKNMPEKDTLNVPNSRDSRTSSSQTSRPLETEARPPTLLGEDFRSINSQTANTQPPIPPRPPLTQVFLRDMYLCDENGEPRYCFRCGNYKPDRTHHCSEVGRCVENFDHFCPWVGGVVGLSSYKFFLQFICYGCFYCIYTIICMAVFLSEKLGYSDFEGKDAHWVVVIALGGFFGLFIIGMFITNVQMLYWGCTTLENFDRKTKRYYVARLDSKQESEPPAGVVNGSTTLNPSTTTSATSRSTQPFFVPDDATRDVPEGFKKRILLPWPSAERPRTQSQNSTGGQPKDDVPPIPRRYYKIYLTPSGLHPWGIGFKKNFIQIMGPRVWDWFLPTHRPFRRPKSGDGELAEGIWGGRELHEQMKREKWTHGSKGAAMAREHGVSKWYEFSPKLIEFLDECDKGEDRRKRKQSASGGSPAVSATNL